MTSIILQYIVSGGLVVALWRVMRLANMAVSIHSSVMQDLRAELTRTQQQMAAAKLECDREIAALDKEIEELKEIVDRRKMARRTKNGDP